MNTTDRSGNNPIPTEVAKERASALFLQYHNLVRQVAFRLAPSSDLVNDITHDVFINFVSNAENWNLDGNVASLLWKIT